jgi:ribosomal protein S18 acetylase RimI-like enzyme
MLEGHRESIYVGRAISLMRILPEHGERLADVLRLLCDTLGKGAYTHADLEALVRSPDALILGATIAPHAGPLPGVAVAQRLSPEDLSYYERFGRAACAILDGHTVGSIAGLAVRPDLRGQGVGKHLTEEVIRSLRHLGCDLIVAISWVSGGSNPSRPLFEKLGFKYIAEAPNVYLDDSLERGLVCDFCGGPCHCSGILYVLYPRKKSGTTV